VLAPDRGHHGNYAGDHPVQLVNADGTGSAKFETDLYAITDLFDADGSAFLVHAGARSACGRDRARVNARRARAATSAAPSCLHPGREGHRGVRWNREPLKGPGATEAVVATTRSEMGDAALLAAVAEGDRGALRSLYERHAPWLALRLARRCADPGLVEEIVQDTFVAVWKSAKRYRGQGEVAAWIWGIGIRRLIDRLRRPPPALLRSEPVSVPVGVIEVSAEEQVLLGI
jgi:hypothetical protein